MRRVNSNVGMSGEIEQVVTKLLRTTKALLEALTQWSLMRASNDEIFEIHDTLEKQFFLVSQAFEEASVSMSDLQWIPRQLRDSVSVVMLELPSPAILDQYLPRIREVIVHLLHGLKGKQALLREREREREAAAVASRGSQSWNREVPLAALNRNSSNSSTNSRIVMYPQQPQSPPLMPLSPRGNEYDPWSGGMPRPSVPVNDLSSRIIRNNGPRSPPSHSPNLSHQQVPLPSRSTSSTRQQQRMPTPPTPPPPPPPPVAPPAPIAAAKPNLQQGFDESDPNTASVLAALKRQENLPRRSSVRRASMFRGNNSDYTGGSISRGAKQQQQSSETVPPVPTLSLKNVDYNVSSSLNTVSEVKEVEEEQQEQSQDLTLFLQIGKEVQRVKYNGEISIPALNMLFLEKFSASIRQNDFPKIYIRDPSVGVSYELEDLFEVKNKSVLSLNIQDEEKSQKNWLLDVTTAFNKELGETRRLFTEQLNDMKKQITDNQKEVEQQIVTILSEHQLSPPTAAAETATVKIEQVEKGVEEEEKVSEPQAVEKADSTVSKEQFEAQRSEIETLRRDLAVLRQLDHEMREGTSTILTEIKAKAKAITDAAESSPAPTTTSAARSALEEGKTTLHEKSDKVTSRLEELQDTIDQLKLDVTQRKCRPSETIMTHCTNERKALAEEIEAFGQFITQVKPRWKKTWEQELQTIVKEQQTLKDQEYLLSDMKDDLDALLEVFEQLQKIYAYQANTRPQLREFRVAPAEEGFEGMNSVLKQVSTIDVDHSRRLKALEQADKMRQRELANRIDDFEKELVGFVETKKLKKTGGALEIDRLRKQKDEEMMKAMFAEKKKASSGISTPVAEEEPIKEEGEEEQAALSTKEVKADEAPEEVKEE